MKLTLKWVLPVLSLVQLINFMDRSVLGIVNEALRLDLGLSDSQMGILQSVLLIGLIFLTIPGSFLNDIFKRRKVMSIAVGIWCVGLLGTGTASGFIWLFFARFLCSTNDAICTSGAHAWLSSVHSPDKLGRVLGAFSTCGSLGMCLGTLFGGFMLALTGSWRYAFLVLILPGIIGVLFLPKLPDNQVLVKGKGLKDIANILKIKSIWLIGFAGGFFNVLLYAYQTWTPTLLQRAYPATTSSTISLFFSIALLFSMTGPFLGGLFADSLDKRLPNKGRALSVIVTMSCMVLTKCLFFVFVGKVDLSFIFGIMLIDAVFNMMSIPIYCGMTLNVTPLQLRSTAMGVMACLSFLTGGAWGPMLTGFLSDFYGGGATGVQQAMMTLLSFGFFSVLMFIIVYFIYPREKTNAEANA